jgi:hypothetical protein
LDQCSLTLVFERRLEHGLLRGRDDPRHDLDAEWVELSLQEQEQDRHGVLPLLNAVPKGHRTRGTAGVACCFPTHRLLALVIPVGGCKLETRRGIEVVFLYMPAWRQVNNGPKDK